MPEPLYSGTEEVLSFDKIMDVFKYSS
uniref:Uncharacterized protein n=1 Tax=Arundo donax TaxID=35708 RepID=A0A0A8Y800_ARUDO